jgi:putative phosphoribosyl transferase
VLAREVRERLGEAAGAGDLLVLGVPRGGVVTASVLARALGAPLGVARVRRFGAPGQPELTVGAVDESHEPPIVDADRARVTGATPEYVAEAARQAREELARQRKIYRAPEPPVDPAGRTVLIVDDGIAAGLTLRAALRELRRRGPRRLLAAAPVGDAASVAALAPFADEVICPVTPEPFLTVGFWHLDFPPVTDDEVVALLQGEVLRTDPSDTTEDLGPHERAVTIPAGAACLPGILGLPPGARGLVLFAHGSGSGRRSPRAARVAACLHDAALATLRLDLLTPDEADDRQNLFDVDLLTDRLLAAVTWAGGQSEVTALPLALHGASTGAAAALRAAASLPERVRAVVSRGGRPDLAAEVLASVAAPTLLIVGENDAEALALNRAALALLPGPAEIALVPGAGHLFEEPGTLDHAARLARDWFARHLGF